MNKETKTCHQCMNIPHPGCPCPCHEPSKEGCKHLELERNASGFWKCKNCDEVNAKELLKPTSEDSWEKKMEAKIMTILSDCKIDKTLRKGTDEILNLLSQSRSSLLEEVRGKKVNIEERVKQISMAGGKKTARIKSRWRLEGYNQAIDDILTKLK